MTDRVISHRQVLASLGEVVVAWNVLEEAMRTLLTQLVGNGYQIEAIAAEMGAVSLSNALLACAQRLSPDAQKMVSDSVKGFERYREYRNYYVHGARGPEYKQPDFTAKVSQRTGKGKLQVYEDEITAWQLDRMSNDIAGFALCVLLNSVEIPKMRNGRPYTLLEIPPLPDKLQKRLRSPPTQPCRLQEPPA